MANEDRRIMVVKKKVLFPGGDNHFEGFRPMAEYDYRKIINGSTEIANEEVVGPRIIKTPLRGRKVPNARFIGSRAADDELRITSYITIATSSGEVYSFVRGSDNVAAPLSICIQGPVYQEDASRTDTTYSGPLKSGVLREVRKQINPDRKVALDPVPVGFLNFETGRYAGKFGLVYFGLTSSRDATPRKRRAQSKAVPLTGWKVTDVPTLEQLCAEDCKQEHGCSDTRLDLVSAAILGTLKEYLAKFT